MQNSVEINLEFTEIETRVVLEGDGIENKDNLENLEPVHVKEHRFDRLQACHHQR